MEDGRPWLDMAHVVACLNKLDSGVSDKVCLMSRDEQNVLVVSYSELKQCLDQSFSECIHAHRNTPTATSGASTMGGYAGWSFKVPLPLFPTLTSLVLLMNNIYLCWVLIVPLNDFLMNFCLYWECVNFPRWKNFLEK